MLPEWSDEFSVHHEIIDQQHKTLFALAHKAYHIANKPTSVKEIKAILMDFFEYMKTHFKDEEQYMSAIGYPGLEEHKRLHRDIVAEMAGMVKHISSADVLKEMVCTIAKDWLVTHILQEDMLIEKYRKEQQEQDSSTKIKYFYYTCACPGKEHKLSESMHLFVKNSSQPINCKECHRRVTFKETR